MGVFSGTGEESLWQIFAESSQKGMSKLGFLAYKEELPRLILGAVKESPWPTVSFPKN